MKEFLITAAGVIAIVALITTFILGAANSDTMQGQGARIGTKMVTDQKTIQ